MRRYPGRNPFDKKYQSLFFGREDDIEALSKKIISSQITVLLGQSGLGKSSLLNAGVLPKFEKEYNYLPIFLRFGNYSKKAHKIPSDIFFDKIKEQITLKESPLDKISPEDITIWHFLKNIEYSYVIQNSERNKYNGIILVLDQFEEFFTYTQEALNLFIPEFTQAIHGLMPTLFQRLMKLKLNENPQLLDNDEIKFINNPINLKLLIGIREDRFSLLSKLSDYIPSILRSNYHLKPLTIAQAKDAIQKPANVDQILDSEIFDSPKFTYSEEVVEKIINYLTTNGSKNIESFQIQLICKEAEDKVNEETDNDPNLEKISVTTELLGNLSDITKNHIKKVIENAPPEFNKENIYLLLQNGLILEDNDIRRCPQVDGDILIKDYDINDPILEYLVNNDILRREETKNGFDYELIHDTLIEPLLQQKKIRKEIEIQEKEYDKKLLKEKEEKENFKKNSWKVIASVLLLFSVTTIYLLLVARHSNEDAKKSAIKANVALFERNEALNKEKKISKLLEKNIDSLTVIKDFLNLKRIELGINNSDLERKIALINKQKFQIDSLYAESLNYSSSVAIINRQLDETNSVLKFRLKERDENFANITKLLLATDSLKKERINQNKIIYYSKYLSETILKDKINDLEDIKTTIPLEYKINLPLIGNQGQTSNSVGFSIANAVTITVAQTLGIKINSEIDSILFSPWFIYNQIKKGTDCISGAIIKDGLDLLINKGICLDKDFYNQNNCAYPSEQIIQKAQKYKGIILDYDELKFNAETNILSISKIKQSLNDETPVIIGFPVDNDFLKLNSKNYIWKPSFNMNKNMALTSLLTLGYNDKDSTFTVQNSWGKNWGNNGLAKIKYKDYLKYVVNAFIIFPDKEKIKNIKAQLLNNNRYKRLALVIGNSKYEDAPSLPGVVVDSKNMVNALDSKGFEIILASNLNLKDLNNTIDNYLTKLNNYDVGLIYFGGLGYLNGLEKGTYLLPVDVPLTTSKKGFSLANSAYSLDNIFKKLNSKKQNIIILDGGYGSEPTNIPLNTFISFSSLPNEAAYETKDGGYFINSLVKNMNVEGADIKKVFDLVRQDLKKSLKNQTPFEIGILKTPFYFNK